MAANIDRTAARIPRELKRKLLKAAKISGLDESDIVRAALAQFIANCKTADKVIEAVMRHRSEAAK